jgi:hypothetical protein
MGMDFTDLVLGPCMNAFAVPITVAPAKSMPGQPIYGSQPGKPLRGIWSSKPVVIETSTGYHSTNQPTLGIRLADFDALGKAYPEQGDFLSLDGDAAGICWQVIDPKPDGQGGAELELRLVRGRLAQAASDPAVANSTS